MAPRIITRPELTPDQVKQSLDTTENARDSARAGHNEHTVTARSFAGAALVMLAGLVVSMIAGLAWLGVVSFIGILVAAPTAFQHRKRGEDPSELLHRPKYQFAYTCPDDYIAVDTLTTNEREIADRLITDIDIIRNTHLPAPHSDLIDHARNHAVLPGVHWQIANDLLKVSDGIRRLEDIDSSGEAEPAIRSKVQQALDSRRDQAMTRAAVISSYADAIREAGERIANTDATREMNALLADLEDFPSDPQQDQSLASLENLKITAQAVADLYEELS